MPKNSGIGRWMGRGDRLTSVSLWKRPSKLTSSCVHSNRSTWICSSKIGTRSLMFTPSAWYSSSLYPRPTPSVTRPFDRMSTSAACLATSTVRRAGAAAAPARR